MIKLKAKCPNKQSAAFRRFAMSLQILLKHKQNSSPSSPFSSPKIFKYIQSFCVLFTYFQVNKKRFHKNKIIRENLQENEMAAVESV